MENKTKSCESCKYRLWMVGIGQGIQCSNENKKTDGKNFKIPHRKYVCEYYEEKN